MTPFLKLGAVAVLLASTIAFADTIQLGSFASGGAPTGNANTAMNFAGFSAVSTTPSTGSASTFALSNGGGVWGAPLANSSWIGEAPTAGPVGTVNPALGYYTFNTTFTALSSAAYSGLLSVMADDSAEVLLNGTVLVPFGTLGSDGHCADGQPSCLVADNVSLSGLNLLTGANANTLTFVVQQAGNFADGGSDPSGMDFDATLTTSMVPEPGTWQLAAIGLLALGGASVVRKAGLPRV